MVLPKPGKDENEQDFVSRCISTVVKSPDFKEGNTPKGREQATAMCYSQWRNKDKLSKVKNGKILYLNQLAAQIEFNDTTKKEILNTTLVRNLAEEQNGIIRLPRSTLLIGDKLYNNVWHPADELQKSFKTMDNQPFIIDHGDNVEDEIGWMENAEYDSDTKKLTAVPMLNLNTAKGVSALNHIRNRLMAGKAPETSVGFWASEHEEQIPLLENAVHVSARDWEFDHNSLVTRGAGSPDMGIGIGLSLDKNLVQNDAWDTAYVNDLPDGCFAYIEPGGSKDSEGKTVPRGLRHFPYKDKDGKIDLPHLRNALARASQSPFGDKALPKLKAAAKEAGVGDYADSRTETGSKINVENKMENDQMEDKNPVVAVTPGMTKEDYRAIVHDELEKQATTKMQENKEADKTSELDAMKKKIADLETQLSTRTTATRDQVTNGPYAPLTDKQKMIRKRLIGMAIINCTKANEEVHIRLENDNTLPPEAM